MVVGLIVIFCIAIIFIMPSEDTESIQKPITTLINTLEPTIVLLTNTPKPTEIQTVIPTINPLDCDLSYPDFCIDLFPPDLNCDDISRKKFTVLSPDPHGFDIDGDGIGCEN